MVPDDVWAVAAVVLGEQRAHLTGWQRQHAIAAMTALGQSRTHIAWALDTSDQVVWNLCRPLGIRPHLIDQVIDWVGVEMVAGGTGRLALVGEDRNEALRQMAAAGVRLDVMAYRLRSDVDTVRVAAKRLGLHVSSAPDGFNWPHLQRASSAAVRRLEGSSTKSKVRRPLPERRTSKPTAKQRTVPSGNRTAHLRQDDAA